MKFAIPFMMAAIGLAATVPSARALKIDFDSGYSVTGGGGGFGDLRGQPATGTQWTGGGESGTTGAILVTATEGTRKTDQAIRTQPGSDTVKYVSCAFSPSDADLGAPFNASSSVIDYSFALKLDAPPTSATSVVLRFKIGGGKVATFSVLENGALAFANGAGNGSGKPVYARAADGATVFNATPNTYFTVSGTIDYAKKTFTVTVNGVPQQISGSPDFGFFDNGATGAQLELVNLNCNSPEWLPVSIDDIELAAQTPKA